jgi:hypothetical protein
MASAALQSDAGVPVSPRWSTYLGYGGEDDDFGGLTRNDAGEVFVVGTFFQPVGDGGTVPPPSAGLLTRRSVVVARFHGDGGLAQWRLFGGDAEDQGTDIELGPDGKLYVAGISNSQNFGGIPFNKGEHGSTTGQDDGFVAQLDPSTLMPHWLYMLGGSDREQLEDMAVGANGALYVTGSTKSVNFPKAPYPPDASQTENWDGFVSRLTPGADGGTLVWSRLLRGSMTDLPQAIAVGKDGDVFVTGKSDSPNLLPAFPPEGSPWPAGGGYDVFVAKLNPSDGAITKSLYLGGDKPDEGRALVINEGTDTLYIGGTTESPGFPKATLFTPLVADAFVVALNAYTLDIKGWNFVRGPDREEAWTLATDPSVVVEDIVYVGGRTRSRDGGFPLKDAFDTEFEGGEWEGFVTRLEVKADRPVLWSSWVGGSRDDGVVDMKVDPQGRLFLGGNTQSWDLVPPGVRGHDPDYDGRPDGGNDLFLMMVGPDAGTPGPGRPDSGTPDSGTPDPVTPDSGVPDAGQDAGGGTEEPDDKALLGWSCGANATGGGPGVLTLGTLLGLALLASRRRPRA